MIQVLPTEVFALKFCEYAHQEVGDFSDPALRAIEKRIADCRPDLNDPPPPGGGIREIQSFQLCRQHLKNPPPPGVTPLSETVAIFTHLV